MFMVLKIFMYLVYRLGGNVFLFFRDFDFNVIGLCRGLGLFKIKFLEE